jgi:nucleotide-binding universal stress UspA family protein
MTQVETVLVPLDGSGFSESAIPAAGRLAARLGAGIYLLSAVGSADEVDEHEARRLRLNAIAAGSNPGVGGGRHRDIPALRRSPTALEQSLRRPFEQRHFRLAAK